MYVERRCPIFGWHSIFVPCTDCGSMIVVTFCVVERMPVCYTQSVLRYVRNLRNFPDLMITSTFGRLECAGTSSYVGTPAHYLVSRMVDG